MDSAEIQHCFDVALNAVRSAGMIIRSDFEKCSESLGVAEKSSSTDLVTDTDRKVEAHIIGALKSQYPNHKFIGEENLEGTKIQWTEEPTWIIDPIDGTTNFVHRIPVVCSSVALWVNKSPVCGIVYNPIQDEIFSAVNSNGAFLNGFPIRVSDRKDITESIMVTTVFPTNKLELVDADLTRIRTLQENGIRGHRSFGSAALSMAYLACGRIDLYFDYGIHCWDIAAGSLIVREAGGVVMDTAGGELELMNRRVLCACSGDLARQVVPLLDQSTFTHDI